MANRGGGAEEAARYKQYDYAANSSLVLTSENRTRDAHEPSGEPESLWGRMRGKMGDRVQHQRPDFVEDKKKKKEEKKRKQVQENNDEFGLPANKRGRQAAGLSVLDVDAGHFYRPKTRETKEAYQTLLAFIHGQFGEQPDDVLRGAADEVLAVLKAKDVKDPDKKLGAEELLGPLDEEKFSQLTNIGKRITDWVAEADLPPPDNPLDTELGVGVQFEDEDEDEEDGEGDVVIDDEDADDDDDEGKQDAAIHADLHARMDVDAGEEAGDDGLKVQEIDAYWLQRSISKAFADSGDTIDANKAQELAEQVLALLSSTADSRTAENELVLALGFEQFELIKLLMKNRVKIVWCIRLLRANNDEERAAMEAEMAGSPDSAAVLDALRATRTSARDRQKGLERGIREEARRLAKSGGGDVAVVDDEEEGGSRPAGGAVSAQVAARQTVDFESLAFTQGGHFRSNKHITLPEKSERIPYKGYDLVIVPALKPKPFASGERLVPISELPEWMQPAFEGMKELNRIQSRVSETALYTNENMLVCAPTGAGKTNVAMLCIMHQLGLCRREEDGSIDKSAFKIVYIAPMKALVAEMVGNFNARLSKYGIVVKELTGDVNLTKGEVDETQIIVTTPEKWDIITRKSDDRTYANLVRLVVIDEIHLLHDDRGPVLESIVARTIRQVEATQEATRIVGLSATLPNYKDVASFLRVKDQGLFFFDTSYRPCPLAQQYVGINIKKPLQRFQLMNEICYSKVLECAGRHQVLVFVHSRKETAKTAKFIKEAAIKDDKLARFMKADSASREILTTEAETCKDADLKDLLPYGFAIHHAGMTRADRTLVEDLFADGHIQVLCSTATLAWGVNLPAHTVIIKGTQIYNPVKGAWDELSPQDVMQMMGRAGRPQYDSSGEGIIITGAAELQFYLSLFNAQLPIESQFISKLADNLNAEVVLGSVQNLKDAAAWLGYTYLFVRMLRDPNLYGVPLGAADTDPVLLERRLDLAHSAAQVLDKHGLVRYDRKTGSIQATDLGRIASHYYVTYNTIATFSEHLKPTMGDIELCRVFSLAEEFKYMIVRDEEKVELAKLVERVPVPIKESLDEPTAKINTLLQAYISCLKLEGLALSSDMVYVTQSAGRLMRCLFEICLKRGWAGLTERAMALCKMVNHRQWGSQHPLRQFKGLPSEMMTRLDKRDIPWERYYDMTSQELGELIRMPKHGKLLHRLVHQFPRLQLAAAVQPITRTLLKIDLTITPDFKWEDKLHGYVEPWWVWVEDQDGERILHHQYWLLKKQYAEEEHTLSFTVPISEPLPPQYFVRIVSDRWLQCETVLPVSFRQLILPEKFPPPTELLDLQPLPVTALRKPAFEQLYRGLGVFNAIQTQAFGALYNTDDNTLLAAPTGSGKTLCAEFALLRMLSRAEKGDCAPRCVYVAPHDALVKERFAEWSQKFGAQGLGLEVVELTGETAADIKLLERGNIVLSNPEKWDMLSRRWRQRKAVQNVSLFIMDELHLVGGERGPVMEVVCSRMRYIAAQTEQPIRIVGLGHSMANAKDVGEWLGAPPHALFAFPPGVRPVPLEIHITGMDIHNFDARMQAMSRPVFNAILNHARGGKPVLVFVPTRKHARLLALDLLTAAAADGNPDRFRLQEEEVIKPLLERVRDPALKHSLAYGVGLLAETQTPTEQDVVRLLFQNEAIQVVVATASTCWGLAPQASLVVVAGTQSYDAGGLGGGDYPVTDLVQMVGRAGRPGGVDDSGRVLLLCHTPRKEYYKRFLLEPLPVESHLDHFLHDHFNAEIVTRTIETKQDAVDYLTWTLLYRRLALNPNFYGMAGASHRHLSDHLSELVEKTLEDLEKAKAISIEDDMDLSPLNLGMIAAYYYISYTTVELFANSLTAKTKQKGMLEIVSAATEYDTLPVRPGEEDLVRRLIVHAPVALDNPRPADPHTKANALLQAHFSRTQLAGDLGVDSKSVVQEALRLLAAAVDVVASNGWLNPALVAMEMCQMVTQGLWDKDSPLQQLPHITKELAGKCNAAGVSSVFDLLDMEDDARSDLLGLSDLQLGELAAVANRYPDISLSYELASGSTALAGEQVSMVVNLEREMEDAVLSPVPAPRFPARKDEGWWCVVGDTKANSLMAIKRVNLNKQAKVKLDFAAPTDPGTHNLTLYFMCDSWAGCDQEYEVELTVEGNASMQE